MVNKADQFILKRMQNSQSEAIELMYERFADSLYGIALSVLKNEEDAQDVLQDSFVKGWRRLASYDANKGTLFTWLLNITRNTAIDKMRIIGKRNVKEVEITENNVENHTGLEFNPDFLDLRKHLGSLDVKYQEVINALFFRGMTHQEASDELGLPLGTIKSRYKIAMRELRKIFVVALFVYLMWQMN